MGDGIQKRYAIIINGDTEARHFANVENAITALRAEDRSYEIAVASPKAPGEAVASFASADTEGVHKLVDGLSKKMDDDDLLVVYITGHGASGARNEGCVSLRDRCLSLEELKNEFARIRNGRRIIVMDQCYGGKGLRLFADARTFVVTQGSPNETVSCALFSPYFWSTSVPDADSDGVITIQERYAYALSAGKTPSFTQFYSPGPAISLSGIEDRSPPFRAQAIRVTSRAQLEAQLARLGIGEHALVMFSADWCDACHLKIPEFRSLAARYGGRFMMIEAEGVKGSEEGFVERYDAHKLPAYALMGRCRDGKIKHTTVKDPADVGAALISLADSGEDEVLSYIERIQNGERNPETLTHFVRIFGEYRSHAKETIPLLIWLLDNPDRDVAATAAASLGKYGDAAAAAIPRLERALSDTWREKKMVSFVNQAAVALARIGERAMPTAVPVLLRLKAAKIPFVNDSLDDAFEIFGSKMAVLEPQILAMCDEADPNSQEAAIRALQWLGTAISAKALDKIFRFISSENDDVQFSATIALARLALSQPALVDRVLELQKSPEPALKGRCAFVLAAMLNRAPEAQRHALEERFLPPIARLASDGNSGVRTAAAFAAFTFLSPDKADEIWRLRIAALTDAASGPRIVAAINFSVTPTPSRGAIATLVELAMKAEPEMRSAIIFKIPSLLARSPQDASAIASAIIAAAGDHTDADLRVSATAAIRDAITDLKFTDQGIRRQLLKAFVALLRDKDPKVHEITHETVNIWQDYFRDALPEIIPVLSGRHFEGITAGALARLYNNHPDVRPLLLRELVKALQDKDAKTRKKVLLLFEELTFVGTVSVPQDLARAVAPGIKSLENDPDEEVRKVALRYGSSLRLRRRMDESISLSAGPLLSKNTESSAIGGGLLAEYRGNYWSVEGRAVAASQGGAFMAGAMGGVRLHFISSRNAPTFDPYAVIGIGATHNFSKGNTARHLNPAGVGARIFLGSETRFFIDGSARWAVDRQEGKWSHGIEGVTGLGMIF